ncbi:27370_t:CDS:2, partial [Racocetra persica]
FTSVHTRQIGNLIGIAPWAILPRNADGENLDNEQLLVNHYKIPVAREKTLLTPLLQKIELHFYLVRICDKDLAKKTQNDITPKEILVNMNKLDKPELKDHFQILAEYYREIDYEQKICMLPVEEDIDSIIFDTANFALIIVVDYMPRFYKIRRLRNKLPNNDSRYLTSINSTFLDIQFSLDARQTAQNGSGSGAPIEEDQNDDDL